MTAVTSQTNMYSTYNYFDLEIYSQKKKIEGLEEQLENWIRKSGPMPVHAVAYDTVPGTSRIEPDDEVIFNINRLAALLSIERENLRILEEKFWQLKKQIKKTSEELDDKELRVFTARYIDNNSLYETAIHVNYSVSQVKRVLRGIRDKIYGPDDQFRVSAPS
jgi:DNA-directed RNA polymerase specialized sigma24 family protein